MKKVLVLILWGYVLCGCASVDNWLNPYKDMANYMENLSELDQTVKKQFTEAPDICVSLGEHFDSVQEPIKGVAELGIATDKSSQEAYELWKRINECSKAYGTAPVLLNTIQTEGGKYYRDTYRRLTGWWGESSASARRREEEFIKNYQEHLKAAYPHIQEYLQEAEAYGEKLWQAANEIKNYFYDLDKKIFLKRSGGKEFCEEYVGTFISSRFNFPPNENCIYPNGGWYRIASAALSSNGIGTLFVGRSGELRWTLAMDKLIFVLGKKIGPQPYVSGQELGGEYYTYAGIYRYETVMGGMNSVYSFKEFDAQKALEGLYFYKEGR